MDSPIPSLKSVRSLNETTSHAQSLPEHFQIDYRHTLQTEQHNHHIIGKLEMLAAGIFNEVDIFMRIC